MVAHRGDMETYPENTLLALLKAAELGFKYIELDIQFSKDLIPVVIHDDNLLRTTGIDKSVYACDIKELLSYNALTSNNDESSDSLIKIVPLEKAIETLNRFPEITLFVEVKRHSLEYYDIEVSSLIKSFKA